MVSCLLCPRIQYELGGDDKENGVDEVIFEDPPLARATFRFICQLLDKPELDTSSLCFCGRCASDFASIMELYCELGPLLEKIRTNLKSKSQRRLEPKSISSSPLSPPTPPPLLPLTPAPLSPVTPPPLSSSTPPPLFSCSGIRDVLDDNQSEVEDMDQDDFDDDSNTNDADEWAQDPFLDEVKSEQDDEDDIPESDPLQGVGEPSKTKTKTKERSNAFKCHICKRKRTYQTEPALLSHISKVHERKIWIWATKYPCPFCKGNKFATNDPYKWWAHIIKSKKHCDLMKYCEKCNAHFLNDTLFEAHTVLHDVDPGIPVVCGICKETVPQAAELRRHLLFHHAPVLMPVSKPALKPKGRTKAKTICDLCKMWFGSGARLKEHMQTHVDTKERSIACAFCSKSFLTKKRHVMHILEDHETDTSLEKKHKCSSCDKMFISSHTLNRHENFHKLFDKSGRTLKCEICDLGFLPEEQAKLLKHIEEIHGKQQKKNIVKCTVEGCNFGRSNIGLGNIKRHERKEHPHLLIHECKQCDQKYSAANFLETHLQTHSGVGPFHCYVCGKSSGKFLDVQALVHHLARHNGEETFKCDQCPETFVQVANLRAHKILKHNVESEFTCTECGRKFTGMAQLKEHKGKYHPSKDSPKFPCSLCPRIYNTKIQLRTHFDNTHAEKSDQSAYCEFCGFKAKDPHCLKLHILRKHQPEELEKAKKHVCSFCSKKFLSVPELKQHVLTHTNERPFVCHICHKGFTQSHSLKGHLKVHKKDGTFFPKPATHKD